MNKNIFNKYCIFIIFTFCIIVLSAYTLTAEINVNDELWNFQNINKINNGFKIYKDANVIITPLFFYIGVIFLKIFGATLISFKIYNIAIGSSFIILLFILFSKLKLSKLSSVLYTLLLGIIILVVSYGGANYNVLVCMLYILGTLFYLKENSFDKINNNIIQGIIIFLIFLTKQNVVIYYVLGMIISEILLNKSFKIMFKNMFYKLLISFILLLLFLLFLYLNNNLYNFINIAILGMSEFTSHFSICFESLWNIGIVCIIITVVIMYITNKNLNVNKIVKSNIIKLLCLGICLLFMMYPIINIYHSLLASFLIYILGCYVLENILLMYNNKYINIIKKILVFFLILLMIFISIYSLIKYVVYINANNCEEIPVYSYCIIDKKIKSDILNITDYIYKKEKKVIIFSDYAALYMIPLNISNGIMDLPFIGNMGYNGENSMLNNIKKLKNCEVLIIKKEEKEKSFTQQSEIIWNYITNNYKKIGEIEKFNIYEF